MFELDLLPPTEDDPSETLTDEELLSPDNEEWLADPTPDLLPTATLGAKHAARNDSWTIEDAYADLAMAVCIQLVEDLQCPKDKLRLAARKSVSSGAILFWVDVLPISNDGRARLLCLLENLASHVSPFSR